jgi:hypothetical protein
MVRRVEEVRWIKLLPLRGPRKMIGDCFGEEHLSQ